MKRSDPSTDATLTPSQAPTSADVAPTGSPTTARLGTGDAVRADKSPAGYRVGALLGKGGMGEVLLAEDLRIGRDVAIKRMRGDQPSADAIARFLREARIQARLDHPAVVPVHELGYDEDGRPYFTMKRLAGTTLLHVLEAGEATQQKLLRAFVEVCLAVDFAHARGVVHRDLKPSNIMLGDYGEMYVLDWGVARVLAEQEQMGRSIDSLDGETQAGAILGTPGYMSPEQVKGDPVTLATDIYALGSILFEILTGEAAHPGGPAGLASTVQMPTVSPAKRTPARAIAPELDDACMAALAGAPAQRPTARELADRIQQYLDGDRDVAQRKELAAAQLALARQALDSGEPGRRAEAMNAAGRALALDPESTAAAQLVTQLMIEPPARLPPPLAQKLENIELASAQKQGRIAALSLGTYCAFLPIVAWVGVTDWVPVMTTFLASVFMIVLSVYIGRQPGRIVWAIVANFVMIVMLSRVFGPFVVIPGLAAAAAVGLSSFPTLIDRPWVVIATMVAAILAPLALEAADLWASTWSLAGGVLASKPSAVDLSGTPALVLLCLANTMLVVVMALFVRAIALTQRDALRKLEVQAWHLEQLLPG